VGYTAPGPESMRTGNECRFRRGIASAHGAGDILPDEHDDHRVFLHEQCAAGHDLIEKGRDSVEVTCPECGAVEVRQEGPS